MYTAYFEITYTYNSFTHTVYVQKTIAPGMLWHPLNDQLLMGMVDERIQSEMNEYYYGEEYRESDRCDIDINLISATQFNEASSLFLKIVI